MIVDAKAQQAIRHILLAEDDKDDQELFKEALSEIDSSIGLEFINNGASLLNLLLNFLPDILFLDLDMPIKNGLQCLQEIRSNSRLADLPVVVFSSTTRPGNIVTAYEMGAHLFFIKPSNYQELVRSINIVLKLDWSDPSKIKKQYCIDGKYQPLTESTFPRS